MISQFLDFIHRKVVDAIHFHYNQEEAICLFFFLRVLTFFLSYPIQSRTLKRGQLIMFCYISCRWREYLFKATMVHRN